MIDAHIIQTGTKNLAGRIKYSTLFVEDQDIKDKTILDIGCGFGWFENNALQRGCRKIVGLEINPAALKKAKNAIKNPRVYFQTGSATTLPFSDHYFDTVASWEVIEHIPRKTENQMLQEAYRVLKPKGIFYLSTQNRSFWSNLGDPARWLIGHRHYSQKKITALAEANGFRVRKLIFKGAFWEILAVNNLYLAKWIFRREMFYKQKIIQALEKEYQKEDGFAIIFTRLQKIS